MKNQIIIIFLFCGISILNAQTVISSSGNTYSNNYSIVDFTLGEVIINTYSSDHTDMTQGFHQPAIKISSVIDLKPNFTINVYPNPTREFIYINSSKATKDYHLEIYDTDGRLIIRKEMNPFSTTVNISKYATAIYFLRILNAHDNKVKIYKIIKTT